MLFRSGRLWDRIRNNFVVVVVVIIFKEWRSLRGWYGVPPCLVEDHVPAPDDAPPGRVIDQPSQGIEGISDEDALLGLVPKFLP